MPACLLLIPFCAALADDSDSETSKYDARVNRVYCVLWDRSSIDGRLADEQSLELHTDSDVVSIPLEKVHRIEIGQDRETTTVTLAGGARLTGFIESQGLRLVTGDKTVEIAYANLWSAQWRRTSVESAAKPLPVANVKVSGVWPLSSREGATDQSNGTSWNSGDWKGWIELDLGKIETIVEVQLSLDFFPAGNATHSVYLADQPIGPDRRPGKLLKTQTARRRDYDVIFIECPPNTEARYVQIHCPESVSWFALREVQVFRPR